jgi:hypothetical protein
VTNHKLCPLCFSVLEGENILENDQIDYPKYDFFKPKYNIFLRIITFITILVILSSILVNILTYENDQTLWAIIVILAMGYLWVLLRSTFKTKANAPTKLVIQMVTLSIFMFGIDYVTGYDKWSINYVIPFLSMASLLSIISLLVGNGVRFGEYSLYLFSSVLLGMIPFILWLFKLVDELWPSLAAASLSIATIIGMLVFADKETKEEIKKRFHI